MKSFLFLSSILFSTLFTIQARASIHHVTQTNSDLSQQTKTEINVDAVVQLNSALLAPTTGRFAGANLIDLKLKGVESNEAIQYQVGYPQVPVIRFLVEGDVQVGTDKSMTAGLIPSGSVLRPAIAPVIKIPGQKPKVFFNEKAYLSNEYWPSARYLVQAAGSKNGVVQKLVTLFPVAIQTSTGKYIVRNHFTLTVTKSAPSVDQLQTSKAKPMYAFVVGAQFANSPSLASYVALKDKLGFQTIVGVVGRDFTTPDQIRAWLKLKLKTNLKYALMVGDAEDVPSHPSTIISGVTDHFYRAIDTNDYEKDINGPDIGLGRLSVSNESQLKVVIDKLTRYQNGTFQSQAWLKNVAWIATDDRYEVAEGTHNYVIDQYTSKLGYSGTFPSIQSSKGGDKLYAITHNATESDVLKSLVEGRSIVNYSGHGGEDQWVAPHVSQDDVRGLKNRDALPFVISNACVTGNFQVSESFAESWQRSPAAAIAFWGSMDNTTWDEDDILERRMYDGIFKGSKIELGEVTSFALASVWQQYGGEGSSKYYWETYVLFGDPSIKLRLSR